MDIEHYLKCASEEEMEVMMELFPDLGDYHMHHHHTSSLVTNPAYPSSGGIHNDESMREVIFRIAAMQPVDIDPESVKAPKRRNVKISKEPQSVAARLRRERISERIRILQRLVPGGTKMDTASMLDEAIHYVTFLKTQVHALQMAFPANPPPHFPSFN